MGSALLSRFDLVFILMDKPDADLDAMLSDHVMALHAGRRGNSRGNATAAPGSMVTRLPGRNSHSLWSFTHILVYKKNGV